MFSLSEILAFTSYKMGSLWGFEKGRGRRADTEAGSLDGRLWQWCREKWRDLGDSSGEVGSDWIPAVPQDGADGICHALGLPALYLPRR